MQYGPSCHLPSNTASCPRRRIFRNATLSASILQNGLRGFSKGWCSHSLSMQGVLHSRRLEAFVCVHTGKKLILHGLPILIFCVCLSYYVASHVIQRQVVWIIWLHVDQLKTKIHLYYIERFRLWLMEDTVASNRLMLCREIIAVCSEIHTKHINTAVWAERRIGEC